MTTPQPPKQAISPLAEHADAYVVAHPDAASWTIGSGGIAKTLAWEQGRGLYLESLVHRTTGHTWQSSLAGGEHAGGEFTLSWNGRTFSARQATALHAVHADAGKGGVTLQIDLRLGDALDVSLFYRAHARGRVAPEASPPGAVIEQWLEVIPLQEGAIGHVAPVNLCLAGPQAPTLHWIRSLQNHGHYTPASGPYPAYRLCDAQLGSVSLHSGLRSTWHEIAWLAVDSNGETAAESAVASEGLFAGLLYSGRWSAHAEAGGAEQPPALTLALATEGYVTPLTEGQRWTSPTAFLGVYHGGLDDAAHVQHAYLRAAVLPPTPDDFPWVQYNTWFAHLVDIDETILRAEADLAARLGAEVFVIDAGWWEPSLRTRDNFTTGLGQWRESREKFPSGLKAFADYVRGCGMRFGIWVEPERVDLRQPGTWRLDWVARHHDAIISPPWPPDTVSGWLCYGHPAVQAWAIDWISRLVADLQVEWLKWDSNWWGVCTCAHHGHSPTDGEFHQVQGVHNVLAELRRRFPYLRIENCAGGGARTDFAMLGNTHATWLHDSSTPNRRVRFHLGGAAYIFPPELSNTFVVDAPDESLTDLSTPPAALDEIARSRMLGAYGVSARLTNWTPKAFAAVQRAIAQYKELRPLLKHGRFYHLLPQPDLTCPDLLQHDEWEAYAVSDRAAGRGALWVFRAPGADAARTIRLRGLDPTAHYRLVDADRDPSEAPAGTGAHWMETGLYLDLAGRTSALILIAPGESA